MENLKSLEITAFEKAQSDIQKADRCQHIWEILMDTLGCTYEDGAKEVLRRMNELHKNREKAISLFQSTVKNPVSTGKGKKKGKKDDGVSVGDY